MNLATGKEVRCAKVTETPVSESVINLVNKMGRKEGFKSMKISNKHGQVLWDSAWVAGVD